MDGLALHSEQQQLNSIFSSTFSEDIIQTSAVITFGNNLSYQVLIYSSLEHRQLLPYFDSQVLSPTLYPPHQLLLNNVQQDNSFRCALCTSGYGLPAAICCLSRCVFNSCIQLALATTRGRSYFNNHQM